MKILTLGEGGFFGFENSSKGHKNKYSVRVESSICEVMSIPIGKLMLNVSENVQAAIRDRISQRNVHLDYLTESCIVGRVKAYKSTSKSNVVTHSSLISKE